MAEVRIFYVQQTGAPGANHDVPTREQLREQIRQTIQDAQQAAHDAQQAQHEARSTRIIVPPGMPVPVLAPSTPGAYVPDHYGFNNVIPPQLVDISVAFFAMCAIMVIGWPIARAFGRRLERRGEVATLDPAAAGQLQRIEQAVEAMSIEIERISESQRFMARLQSGSAGDRGMMPSAERR